MGLSVFRPVLVEGLEWVQPLDENDFDAVYQLDGTPRATGWEPIPVRRLETLDNGQRLEHADLPWLGNHALVFRHHAFQLVEHILVGCGEFLPLSLIDGTDQLWLFNAWRVDGALDEEACSVVRFASTGRVMSITRHVFHPERIAGLAAFRVPQVRTLFFGGAAVDSIDGLQLSGAAFQPVWEERSRTRD